MTTMETNPVAKASGLRWNPSLVLPAAIFAVCLTVIAWPMLVWWKWEYTKPETYYGFATFVPFIVAFMLYAKRATFAATPSRIFVPALVPTAFFLFLLVFAAKQEMQAIMSGAFLLTLSSAVWFLGGTRILFGPAFFPLLYLWLMAPLPGPVLNDMTLGIQGFSTVGAAQILKLIFMGAARQEGNMIYLEHYILHVDVPCSGFKLLLTLLTFASAFAYLTDTTLVKRWALFLISLPLSVLVNSIRIAMIGIAGETFGTSAAVTFHDWSGMISLVLCAFFLFSIAKALKCKTFAGHPIF